MSTETENFSGDKIPLSDPHCPKEWPCAQSKGEFKWQCSRVNIRNVKHCSRVNIGFSRDNAELAAVRENDELKSFRMRDSNWMN